MGKLFLYEIRKNILKLSLLFLIIGLTATNIYKIRETIRYEGTDGFSMIVLNEEPGNKKIHPHFYGKITPELIEKIKSYSNKIAAIIASGDYDTQNTSDEFYTGYAFSDNMHIEEIKQEVTEAYLYPNTMAEVRERAQEQIDFFEGINDYEVRKAQLIKDMYNGRKINVYGDFEAVELYLDYEFSSFIIMIMMIFVFSAAFTVEKSTGTDKIIKSGGNAGRVFWAKHFTVYSFAFIMTVIFSITDILYFGNYYGLSFFEQPLYTASSYRNTPYNITIFGALGLSMIFKTLALIFIGEVIMVISSITKNPGASMVLCFGAIGSLIFANGYIPEFASPFTLFSTEKMICEFKCLNIFGFPVPSAIVTLIIVMMCILLLHILCYRITSGKTKVQKEAGTK